MAFLKLNNYLLIHVNVRSFIVVSESNTSEQVLSLWLKSHERKQRKKMCLFAFKKTNETGALHFLQDCMCAQQRPRSACISW